MNENTEQKYKIVNMLVERVIQHLQIQDYRLEIDDSSATANGFLGVIFFVKVIDKKGTLNLVVKAGSQNEKQRNFINIGDIFGREIYFYKKILPAMSDFQKARLVKQPFISYPKCYEAYSSADCEGLVLENLKAKGFSLWNRLVPMDENHISLVLREYGRFHAISLAMKDQNPEQFKQLTRNYDDCFNQFLIRVKACEHYRNRFKIISDVLSKQGRQELSAKVKKFIDEIEPVLMNCAKPDDQYSVILHGDCWCNNMMFRYEVKF